MSELDQLKAVKPIEKLIGRNCRLKSLLSMGCNCKGPKCNGLPILMVFVADRNAKRVRVGGLIEIDGRFFCEIGLN